MFLLRERPFSDAVSVFDYETAKGCLHVEHAYPHNVVPTPRAYVDVNLVLETVSSKLLQSGSWVNLIGYVKSEPIVRGRPKRTRPDPMEVHSVPEIQAVLLWDAGIIRAEDYESTMEEQRSVQKQIRHLHET